MLSVASPESASVPSQSEMEGLPPKDSDVDPGEEVTSNEDQPAQQSQSALLNNDVPASFCLCLQREAVSVCQMEFPETAPHLVFQEPHRLSTTLLLLLQKPDVDREVTVAFSSASKKNYQKKSPSRKQLLRSQVNNQEQNRK